MNLTTTTSSAADDSEYDSEAESSEEESEGEESYEVSAVLDTRVKDGNVEYLVEWEGWPGADTWEPEAHLHNNLVLKEYLAAKGQ